MKKVRKNTRPFRYDLNQIPYNYTVEVRNRFKGLDLTERVPEELWTGVHDIVHGEGQGSLACCSPWGCTESDMTEQLNNTVFYFIEGPLGTPLGLTK